MNRPRTTNDWQNVGRKLPLLTTVLLSVAVVVIAAMAYRGMKQSLITAAGERVVNVARQISDAFAASNDRLHREGSPLSRDSAVVAVLLHSDTNSRAAARRRLAAERTPSSQVRSIELWNARGDRVLVDGNPMGQAATFDDVRRGAAKSPLGPIIADHDTILTDVRLPVISRSRDTVGFIRELSLVSSAQSKQLLRGLIGGQAELLVGNDSGDVWTDLSGRVAGPRVPHATRTMVRATGADGSAWIGALSQVSTTPWLVWVGLPESVVASQTDSFLLQMSVVSLLVIVLGAFGASMLSRHIISPLIDVTHAAEGLAAGDYAVRVAVVRHDEVGRLAAAFNEMAGAIQAASLDLQNQQVELETQQVSLEEANEELRTNIIDATNAREAAERSRTRAAAIVAGAIDAVITVNETGIIVEFNPAAESTFGFPAREAIGRTLDQLIPATTGGGGAAGLRRYLEGHPQRPRGRREELTAVRADGTPFAIELVVTRIPVPGVAMFTCFVRDLSERKQLEAQLQQSQKMEAVGRLAGGVAHDFNNILTVIVSYADLALSDSSAPESVRSDLTQVRKAADRASALTRQLLAFSRKQVLHPAVLDLNAVVRDVSTMLARVIPENIRFDAKPGANIFPVYVDRGQLEQVLMNLAVNARDAMPNGGALTIETANVVLDEAYVAAHSGGSPGPHAVLSVRDTGVGMDAATRERIFEPFFTTKSVGQGTGLGLATVYGIVRQSGGGIYVYSEPGLGTTFKVYFRAHAGAADARDESAASPLESPGTMTILLVEDDPAVRQATRLVLQHLGHEVVPAPDVATALEVIRARAQHIDVVLTDAVMPGQSGLDLAEILSTERPGLPVILMSGYTEEAVNGGRAMAPGVLFLEKPFTGQGIARALSDVAASARSAPRRVMAIDAGLERV